MVTEVMQNHPHPHLHCDASFKQFISTPMIKEGYWQSKVNLGVTADLTSEATHALYSVQH